MEKTQQGPAKNAQQRSKSHQRTRKKPFWRPKSKTTHQVAKKNSPSGGCGGLAEAGGGVRGGKLPEFADFEALSRTLRSLRKRRVRRIELASRDRRTLVGVPTLEARRCGQAFAMISQALGTFSQVFDAKQGPRRVKVMQT